MRFFRKRDFKVIGKGKDLRENDVREIKGEGNFKKGVIIVKKKKSYKGIMFMVFGC